MTGKNFVLGIVSGMAIGSLAIAIAVSRTDPLRAIALAFVAVAAAIVARVMEGR